MWAWKICTDQSNDSTQFLLLGAKQDGDVLQWTPFAYHKREGVLPKPLQKQEIIQESFGNHFSLHMCSFDWRAETYNVITGETD